MTPSQVGERAEAALIAALIHTGKTVYLPLGASGRCDLIFEDERGLHRVQVKNGVFRDRVVSFATCSNTANVPKDYRGQIDYFGVWSPPALELEVTVEPDRECTERRAETWGAGGERVPEQHFGKPSGGAK